MHMATITGYMKFMVEAIPLAMFAYPIRRVIDVSALRKLNRTTFHTSSNDESFNVFFLAAA